MSTHEIAPPVTTSDDTKVSVAVYEADQHNIRRSAIDEDARKVVYRLQRAGFKAYIVGGGVRDILLGKTPKDFDISTDATPRQIKSLFRNCRIIGRRFKLAHVFFANGKTLEVSTFRDTAEVPEPADGDVPSSAPLANDNIYGTEETDARRRDLTINGLFLDVSTMQVIDYVEGMRDLHHGTIRIIGDPDVRFREDPVRMLRAVRHSARNGFRIEARCWDSIVRNAQLISQCSQVRVFEEIRKDLSSGCFLTILSLLGETGLLEHILPELLENNSRLLSAESDCSLCLEKIDDLVSQGSAISSTAVLAVLALFMGGDSIWLRDLADSMPGARDLGERIGSCFTHFTVPRKERERIQLLLALWGRLRSTPPRSLKVNSYKRSVLLTDLISLVEITQISRDDTQRLHLLKGLVDAGDSSYPHSDHPQRPRQLRRN